MSTPCRHDNRRNLRVWANRLILSRLALNPWTDDDDVPDILSDEIADCPGCWRAIAVYSAALASEYLFEACGDDEAEAIAWVEDRIARALGEGDHR